MDSWDDLPVLTEESWDSLPVVPPEKQRPFIDITDTASALGEFARGIPTTTKSSYYQIKEGLDNPWKRSENYLAAGKATQEYQKELDAAEAAAVESGDISSVSSAFRAAAPSSGFTVGAMGSALAGGSLLGTVGGRVGAAMGGPAGLAAGEVGGRAVGAFAGSYGAAYRAAGAQFLDDARDEINHIAETKFGRPLTEAEQEEAYQELLPLAQAFGNAEAGPEAIGNLAMGAAGRFVLGLGRETVKRLATGALAKAGAVAGGATVELGGETATQVEQKRIEEQKAALLEGRDPAAVAAAQPDRTVAEYATALEEVGPATLATLFLMGGAGKVASKVLDMSRPAPVSLTEEELRASVDLGYAKAKLDEEAANAMDMDLGYERSRAILKAQREREGYEKVRQTLAEGDIEEAAKLMQAKIVEQSVLATAEEETAPTETATANVEIDGAGTWNSDSGVPLEVATDIVNSGDKVGIEALIKNGVLTPPQVIPVAEDNPALAEIGDSLAVAKVGEVAPATISALEATIEPVVEEPVAEVESEVQTPVPEAAPESELTKPDMSTGTVVGPAEEEVARSATADAGASGIRTTQAEFLQEKGITDASQVKPSRVKALEKEFLGWLEKRGGAHKLVLSQQRGGGIITVADWRQAYPLLPTDLKMDLLKSVVNSRGRKSTAEDIEAALPLAEELMAAQESRDQVFDGNRVFSDIARNPLATEEVRTRAQEIYDAAQEIFDAAIPPDPFTPAEDESVGAARNAEAIRQAAARLKNTERGPDLGFSKQQPTGKKDLQVEPDTRTEAGMENTPAATPRKIVEEDKALQAARAQALEVEKLKREGKITPDDDRYWSTPIEGQPKDTIPNVKDTNGVRVKEGDLIEFGGVLGGTGRGTVSWMEPHIANASGEVVAGAWVGNGVLREGGTPFTIIERDGEPFNPATPPVSPQTAQAAAETQTPAPSRKGAGAAGVVERQPTEGSIPVVESTVVQTPPVSSAEKEASPERTYTVYKLMKGNRKHYIPDLEPMTHKEALTFRTKMTNPAEWGLEELKNSPETEAPSQTTSPAVETPTESLPADEKPMSGDSGTVRKPKKAPRKPKSPKPVTNEDRAPVREEATAFPATDIGQGQTPEVTPAKKKYKPNVGDLISGTVNGVPVVGKVTRVSGGGTVTAEYGNGKEFVTSNPVPAAQALATAPKYQYTQEQNTAKAARLGLPTTPGVTEDAGALIQNVLVNVSKDTRLSPLTRAIARALRSVNFDGVRLRIKADGRSPAGLYTHEKGAGEIMVNLRAVARGQVDSIGVFLHEALHHATMEKLFNPAPGIETEAVDAIKKIVDHVKTLAGPDTVFDYELSSPWEFVSALFTRPDFQNYLASVPAPGSPTGIAKFRSALSELFRRLAELVTGQKVQKGSTMEQAIAATMVLFETPQRTGDGAAGAMAEKMSPDKARAILTKRFGKAGGKFVVGAFNADGDIEWDAKIGDGNITLNLKYLDTEAKLIAKAEHELAHAVFDDPTVQQEWKAISRTLSPAAREKLAARLKGLGYADAVLDEEMLVQTLEEIRRNTPPAAWQRFVKAVRDALLRLFGMDVSQGDAERAAARIVAAGEAALAQGLDPAVEAFGQSVVEGTRYSRVPDAEFNKQTETKFGSEKQRNIRPAAPQQETANKASAIIGEAIAKDPVNGRMNALLRFDSDTKIPLEVRAIGAAMLAEQVEYLNVLSARAGNALPEATDLADDFVDRAISVVQRLGTELGRGLNIFNALARLTPEGFIRRRMRQHAKGVDEVIRQNFTGDLRSEIERLWKAMQDTRNTDRGKAFAEAVKEFLANRPERKKDLEEVFKSIRTQMAEAGGESLVRDFFQMMAGPRDQAGPLAEFDASIQSALSGMLRKVMESKGLVAENQSVQATDIDKLVRSVSADALRFEKIAAADAAMQEELDKIEDPERRAVLQQAWEEATSKMYTNIASEATLRRAVNAQLKETPVEWTALYDKNKGTSAEKSRVVAAVMSKVEALLTNADDKGVQQNLDMLRSEVAEAFDQVAAIKRAQWLAGREAAESRRRTAERKAAFVEALKVKGISEKALLDLNAKLDLPARPGAERNEVSVLIGDNIKTPVEDFVAKLTALGVDQDTAEALDRVSVKLRAEYAEAARVAALEALKLAPTKLTRQAIERLNSIMAGPMKPHVKGEVATLISEHSKAIVPDFVERMVALGVDRAAAVDLDNILKTSRVDRFLASLLKVAPERNKTAKEKLSKVIRTALEAGNLGAMDSQQFMGLFAKEFGLPPMTKEFKAEIKELVRGINALPKGPARIDAIQALEEKLALWEGIKTRDVLMSTWYANILSGVSTQFIGLLYNNLNLFLKSAVTMLANPKSAKAFVQGALGEGLKTGLKEAGAALQGRGLYKVSKWGDKSIINGLELLNKQGPIGPAQWAAYIASAGTFTRRVFHLMAAVDALAWNTAREGHAYLAAHRALREELAGTNPTAEDFNRKFVEKLGGDTAQIEADLKEARDQLIAAGATPDLTTIDRMARQMRDDRRTETQGDNRFADRIVVQQEPEGLGRLVSALITAIQQVNIVGAPVGQMLVPFNKIVSNLFEQSLDYTPVGIVRGALGGHLTDVVQFNKDGIKFREGSKMFDSTERWERAITGTLATSIGFALYALAASMKDEDDEDVPFMIYAFGPTDKNKRSQMPKGWAPFTIKIGDVYYKFAEAPFGMMFAGIGSALDAIRYEKMDDKTAVDKLTYVMKSAAKGFMTQGVLSSVDTAIDVLMLKASDKKLSDIPVSAMKGAIPGQGFLRDLSTLTDDRKIDGSTMKAAMLRDIPFVKSYAGNPELNRFGEPVTFDGLPVVRRFGTMTEKDHVADYLGRNDLYIPGMPPTIEVGSYLPKGMKDRLQRRALEVSAMENGMFTLEQNYEFKKRVGQLTKVAVERIMQANPPITNDVQRKKVQSVLNKQIEIARKRAMLEAVPIK